ncbi:hypothetical protein PRVXT_002075 [Proteinivorax tanatarense]|uniref:ATP synthase F0 subunit 8 n=1 Tax=Proteinivorax tanatarense TaxID=1260629 RepID=A0AAU7VJJ3_9FIRM
MSFDINIAWIFSLFVLMPFFSFTTIFFISKLKKSSIDHNFDNTNLVPLINVDLYKKLTVVNYEAFNKYQVWKLYNQY